MKPELLAPAGSPEAMRAAVQNGADAVYLGLKQYSAREAAENFTQEELSAALDYCHLRGVFVYLTLNTLIEEKEIETALQAGIDACNRGVDGVIVQDLGLASRLISSQVPVHASTQLTVYNREGAEKARELGFTRCVLARELSLTQIEEITKAAGIETEVFCHGALCMSYSGQCLMSYCQGGRSGNKGDCAQPCRRAYRLEEQMGRHHLSPADLCTLPVLDKLVNTGVSSLKIEGRLKSPEYVAAVTGIYRKALDKIAHREKPFYTKEDMDTLTLSFCRSHFTLGYLQGKLPSKDITLDFPGRTGIPAGQVRALPRRKKGPVPLFELPVQLDRKLENGDGIGFGSSNGGVINSIRDNILTVAGNMPKVTLGTVIYQTYSKKLSRCVRATYENGAENRKTAIAGHFTAKAGEKVQLILEDGKHSAAASLPPASTALSRPVKEEDIRGALDTLGNTPYYFLQLDIHIDPGLFLPVSQIKELKRRAIQELEACRCKVPAKFLPSGRSSFHNSDPVVSSRRQALLFYRTEDFLRYPFADSPFRIYLPLKAFQQPEATQKLSALSSQIFAVLPWITREEPNPEQIKAALPQVHGFLAQNIGDSVRLQKYAAHKLWAADLSFNAVNTDTFIALNKMNFSTVTLSPETSASALPCCPPSVTPELVVKGRIPVMRSEHCILAPARGCPEGQKCGSCSREKRSTYFLSDEKGGSYPILPEPEHCRMTVLSKEPVEQIQKNLPRSARALYGGRLIERITIFMEENV